VGRAKAAAPKVPPALKTTPREVPPELRTDLLYRALADDLGRSSRKGAVALRQVTKKSMPLQLLSLKLNYQRRRSDEEIPLSWRLTPVQQKNLDEAWKELQETLSEPFAHTPIGEPISLDLLFKEAK